LARAKSGLASRVHKSGSQARLKRPSQALDCRLERQATLGSRTVSTRLFSMNRYETATKQVDRMGLETWQFAARSSMTTRT
jgi:hypothetical protein